MEPTMFLVIHGRRDWPLDEGDRQLRLERLFAEREAARDARRRRAARAWSVARSLVPRRRPDAADRAVSPCPSPA